MDVSFCLLCMPSKYIYICIRIVSTVGTGVLTCSIVIFIILNLKNKIPKDIPHDSCIQRSSTQQYQEAK